MRYEYPVILTENANGWTVSSPDVAEMVTCGSTSNEALGRAEDALVSALSFYVDEGQPIPRPSSCTTIFYVSVPALEASKLALHEAMLSARVSNVELARRLGLDEKVVRRLRDPLHRSHIAYVEAALRALGRQVVLEVEEMETAEPLDGRMRRAV